MDWDRAEQEWTGALVLVGMTYLNADESIDRQVQFWGRISAVDRAVGIRVELLGEREGEVFDLPPDLRAFEAAPRGEYRLRSSGEVVIDPDLLASWTINPPG